MPEDSVDSRLGRMEGKLDILIDIHTSGSEDHETRLRSLEESRAKLHGISAVLGVATSFIYNLFSK